MEMWPYLLVQNAYNGTYPIVKVSKQQLATSYLLDGFHSERRVGKNSVVMFPNLQESMSEIG